MQKDIYPDNGFIFAIISVFLYKNLLYKKVR
jgi:hypothetical protein